MSLETILVASLQAQCPRVFPDVAPFSTARPYITWQQVGGQTLEYQAAGADALPAERHALIQVNTWADDRLTANTLMLAIEAALIAHGDIQASAEGAFTAEHDEDTNRYSARQDFSIWATR